MFAHHCVRQFIGAFGENVLQSRFNFKSVLVPTQAMPVFMGIKAHCNAVGRQDGVGRKACIARKGLVKSRERSTKHAILISKQRPKSKVEDRNSSWYRCRIDVSSVVILFDTSLMAQRLITNLRKSVCFRVIRVQFQHNPIVAIRIPDSCRFAHTDVLWHWRERFAPLLLHRT